MTTIYNITQKATVWLAWAMWLWHDSEKKDSAQCGGPKNQSIYYCSPKSGSGRPGSKYQEDRSSSKGTRRAKASQKIRRGAKPLWQNSQGDNVGTPYVMNKTNWQSLTLNTRLKNTREGETKTQVWTIGVGKKQYKIALYKERDGTCRRLGWWIDFKPGDWNTRFHMYNN